MITLQQLAAALIAVFEGCRLTAYQDSGGVWTIGIGHTGADVKPGLQITPEQCGQFFEQDQAHLLQMVAGKPLIAAAALVSFGFNCGAGSLAKVLAGTDTIDNPKYTHDMKGHVLPGLVARRRLELLLTQL